MRRNQPEKVILVCKWNGRSDRFFGKYKSFETGKWVKIPGGCFPPQFDTKEKALLFAEEWYTLARAEREANLVAGKPKQDPTWGEICDAYVTEVKLRMRGKQSTRYEAINIANTGIRCGILATGKPSENDETKCLLWLRGIAGENLAKEGAAPRFRKPNTVRNIAKHLRYVFKAALRLKLIPGMTTNPTMGDEFRDELKGLMALDQPREWLLPLESFAKLVTCPKVPAERRIVYLAYGMTGLRPGELAGLELRHVKKEGSVRYIAVEQQWATKRGKGSSERLDTLKTKWARRNVPLHRSLSGALDEWIESGWEVWVGRPPTQEDVLFPGANGKAHREERSNSFRKDLEAAKCPTEFAGERLTPYSLRHLFSTLLTEAHAADEAHDRLMGHRPKSTKALNYSAKLLPFLAAEIERVPFELPGESFTFAAPGQTPEQLSTEDDADEMLVEESAPRRAYAA